MDASVVVQVVQVVVALVLGGAGYAVIHQFVVRARVFLAWRVERTVRIGSAPHRKRIEGILREQNAPTGFCEVEWWNKGLRSAENLLIQADLPGRILTWELTPPASDVSAPWTCMSDPCGSEGPISSIRIRQEHLMPGTRCRLVLGFDSPESGGAPSARGYRDGRVIPGPTSLGDFWATVTIFACLGASWLVYWVGERVLMGLRGASELTRGDTTRLFLASAATFAGMFVLWLRASRYISTGNPSWHVEREKRK